MKTKNTFIFLGLISVAPQSLAGDVPVVSLPVEALGFVGVPLETGGIAAIAAVSLVIGTQLIKRRK